MFYDAVLGCCLTLEVWPVCHRGTFYLIFLSLVPTACPLCFSPSSGITKRFLGLGPGDSEGTRTDRGPALPEPGFRQAEQQLCLWAGSHLCCAGVTDLPTPHDLSQKGFRTVGRILEAGLLTSSCSLWTAQSCLLPSSKFQDLCLTMPGRGQVKALWVRLGDLTRAVGLRLCSENYKHFIT